MEYSLPIRYFGTTWKLHFEIKEKLKRKGAYDKTLLSGFSLSPSFRQSHPAAPPLPSLPEVKAH